MSFRAQLAAKIGWNWDSGAVDNDELKQSHDFAEGTDSGEAEAVWHVEDQVLLSGDSVTLDLTALTRTVLGDTLTTTLVAVHAILIVNQSTAGGEMVVGGAAANEWSAPFGADGDQVRVPLGSSLLLSNQLTGWAVDDSNKNLKLAASGGNVTYSVAIIGCLTTTGDHSSSSGA